MNNIKSNLNDSTVEQDDITNIAEAESVLPHAELIEECPPPNNTLPKLGLLVAATSIGMFMGALDESIINVSLPTISSYFGVNQLGVQWIVLVYLLVIVGLTAIAGYLGDRYSTKIIFQIGMIIFGIGSLMCALSESLIFLGASRFIQGIGATGLLANGNAIITRFTDEERRGVAIGFTSLIAALGVVVGPVVGGLMTQYWGWKSVFWLNVPVGVIGLLAVQFVVPATPPVNSYQKKPDIVGSLLFAAIMTSLILGITLFVDPVLPYPAIWGTGFILASIGFAVGFAFWEKKAENPFIEISLFKNRKIVIGFTCAMATFVALNSVAFQLPFFLQDMLGFTQVKIGAIIIGVPIGLAIAAPISGKLSSKIDARILSSIGLGTIAIELTCLAIFLSLTIPLWIFIMVATFIGLSIGCFSAPNSNSILSSAPEEKIGVVSGLLSLARNIGYSIGTALSTTIFLFILGLFQEKNGGELKSPENYLPSIRILFGILVIFMVIAITLSILRGPEIRNNNKNNCEIESELDASAKDVHSLDE